MIQFTILSEPASKANSRKIVSFDGRPSIIKSQKGRDYEKAALLQIPEHAKQMLVGKLRVTLRIFYASERPDLDESIILDVLQAKFKRDKQTKQRELIRRGVYLNDRQVREKHVFHCIDRSNPRAEIDIEPFEEEIAG